VKPLSIVMLAPVMYAASLPTTYATSPAISGEQRAGYLVGEKRPL